MVKFKKRVAKHKISDFFKGVPFILFFHGIDRKDLYKALNSFLITEKPSSLKSNRQQDNDLQCKDLNFLKKKNDSIPEIKKRIALQGLIVKSIKNNYAKKNVQQLLIAEKNPSADSLSNDRLKREKEKLLNPNHSLLCSSPLVSSRLVSSLRSRDEKEAETRKELRREKSREDHRLLTDSLFQGKILCLAFDDLSSLGLFPSFLEKNNYILGAFYDNAIIDSSTVHRLASICQNSTAYPLCLDSLKACNDRLIFNLSSLLDFSYFLCPQRKLIALMKMLHPYKI